MINFYNKLEVVLKVSEDCNLGCEYCYFFHEPDQLYLFHPKKISIETVEVLALFLKNSIKKYNIRHIQIDFHGGEPLLIGKNLFSDICALLIKELSDKCTLTFALQTNATLIDKEWCNIFSKYNFAVGISLDGTNKINDEKRKYKNNNGTYNDIIRGLSILQQCVKESKLDDIGILTVVNPKKSSKLIFNHFVNDLNIQKMEFLLPDYTFDQQNLIEEMQYFEYFKTLFSEWLKLDNPNIKIRFLESIVSLLTGGHSLVSGIGEEPIFTITISSDGTIYPDDSLRSCGSKVFKSNYNIKTNSLEEFLNSDINNFINNASIKLPKLCKTCKWKTVCNAGHLVNRWSDINGFNNPTIYCKTMYKLIDYINAEIQEYI